MAKEVNQKGIENTLTSQDRERYEQIIRGEIALQDDRGIIRNYMLPEPVTMIGWITAERVQGRNVVRANHYHPEQEQKVLVISGSYISVYKDLSVNGPIHHHLVRAGDLVITPPNVAHAMIFLSDALILNLVHGDRDREKFAQHTVKYLLVDPDNHSKLSEYLDYYRGDV